LARKQSGDVHYVELKCNPFTGRTLWIWISIQPRQLSYALRESSLFIEGQPPSLSVRSVGKAGASHPDRMLAESPGRKNTLLITSNYYGHLALRTAPFSLLRLGYWRIPLRRDRDRKRSYILYVT
jgi:hypothetical protein